MYKRQILDLEERALITGEYKNISVNDMHIINAVGIREQKNMSTVARELNLSLIHILNYQSYLLSLSGSPHTGRRIWHCNQ